MPGLIEMITEKKTVVLAIEPDVLLRLVSDMPFRKTQG